MNDACEMCDDTGYEPGSVPLSFCTLCSRGLSVAVQMPPSDPVVITEAWYVCTIHGPQLHSEIVTIDDPCPECYREAESRAETEAYYAALADQPESDPYE